eukprot:364647-Chlamydomonas_euryale.AAC.21
MSLPVVRMARGGTQVTLVARSVDEYLHRLLAEEDAQQGGAGARSLAAAAGPEGEVLYKPGDLAASGMGARPAVYVIKKVGMFPDISEDLAHGHLAKGDEVRVGFWGGSFSGAVSSQAPLAEGGQVCVKVGSEPSAAGKHSPSRKA